MEPILALLTPARIAVAVDATAVLFLLAYHLYLVRAFRRDPCRTYHGRSNRLRRAWVAAMRVRGMEILAVQTLRNWVMSATLLGSTSILIGLGVGSFALTGVDLTDLARSLSGFPPPSEELVRIKLLALAGIFFSAFHNFSLALRYYNHVGFMINVPDAVLGNDPVGAVSETLNRAGRHYHRGTRIFLLAGPFALWLIGPLWFLAGVLGELLVLYRFDFREERADPQDSAPEV
jgi:uncharacterized membrane protein